MKKEKKKLTLQEKLAKRKYKLPNRFILFLYYVINYFAILKRFKPQIKKCEEFKKYKGPCFLVWNHLSRIDHAYLIHACYPRRITILAEYNEFFRSHLKFAFRMMNIVPKKNFATDIGGVRAMASIIKQGGCLCLSPEGMSSIYGTNQPVVAGTGNFIKHYKIPVFFIEMHGQYLANTKHCLDERPGTATAEVKVLLRPEDLANMTGQEVENVLNKAFKSDEFEWNKEHRIKFKNDGTLSKNLSDLCYKCPKCGAELQMEENGNKLTCKCCGNGMELNDYYDMIPLNDDCIIPESPSKWVEWERCEVIREIRENPNYSYSFNIKLGKLLPYETLKNYKTSEICGEGVMTVDHDGMHYVGTKDNEKWSFDLDYKNVLNKTGQKKEITIYPLNDIFIM